MSRIINILIVDDSKAIVRYLLDILNNQNHNLLYTFSREEAEKIISHNAIDLMICDLMLPEMEDGLQTIRYFKEKNSRGKVLGISAHSELNNVIKMMQAGADDFLPKTTPREQIIAKLEELKRGIPEYDESRIIDLDDEGQFILGKSEIMQEIFEQIKVVAENDVESCLIVGESGTGKELVAKTIYQLSPRKGKPFIALNCAGMPDNLIDSELFGHERGSFTGAYNSNPGKFELADGGVLFLDEISEIPFHLQAKLLRVLENREIMRLGGKKNIPINVTVLAATNRNLDVEIQEQRFREDIYYRLSMVKIELPPLRERKEDIPELADYFLHQTCRKLGKDVQLADNARNTLMQYDFPGNVRELKNVIYNSVLFAKDFVIQPDDLLRNFRKGYFQKIKSHGSNNDGKIDDSQLIIEILKRYKGNITLFAKELGYTREGLSRKLKKLNIDKDSFK
ncbi:MAG: sigma-54 dependent transcriptional regulator [Calditrichia bacterium]